MAKLLPREVWTNRPPKDIFPDGPDETDPLPNFVNGVIEGVCIHYCGPGSYKDRDPYAVLRAVQNNDMDNKGYSDIMYNAAVPLLGDPVLARGFINRGAANGTYTVNANSRWLSILLIMGASDVGTVSMVDGVHEVIRKFRAMYPTAVDITDHGTIRPTACPGSWAHSMVVTGGFEPAVVTVPACKDALPQPPLTQGMFGAEVVELQNLIKFWWPTFYPYKVDGVFGPMTKQAVIKMQEQLNKEGHNTGAPDGTYNWLERNALRVIYHDLNLCQGL